MQFIIHFSNCSGLNPAMRKETKRRKMFAILAAIILSVTALQLTTAEALAQTPASIIYVTNNMIFSISCKGYVVIDFSSSCVCLVEESKRT